jgi:hypothetical protein
MRQPLHRHARLPEITQPIGQRQGQMVQAVGRRQSDADTVDELGFAAHIRWQRFGRSER